MHCYRRCWRNCFHPGRLCRDTKRWCICCGFDEGPQTPCTACLWDAGWGLSEQYNYWWSSINRCWSVEVSWQRIDSSTVWSSTAQKIHQLLQHDEDNWEKRPRDRNSLYPSRLYHFVCVRDNVSLRKCKEQRAEIPECAIYIYRPEKVVVNPLLSMCRMISKHQEVIDFRMWNVRCRNVKNLALSFMRNVLHQFALQHCFKAPATSKHTS